MSSGREPKNSSRTPPSLPTFAVRIMPKFITPTFALVKHTATEWIDQGVSRMGAALAFYTLFAIAPLFIIVLAIAGLWFGEAAARRELFSQVSGLVGSEGGDAIQALISAANRPKTGAWATVIAVVTQNREMVNALGLASAKPPSPPHHSGTSISTPVHS